MAKCTRTKKRVNSSSYMYSYVLASRASIYMYNIRTRSNTMCAPPKELPAQYFEAMWQATAFWAPQSSQNVARVVVCAQLGKPRNSPFGIRGELFFGESDSGIKSVLFYWKMAAWTGKIMFWHSKHSPQAEYLVVYSRGEFFGV